MLDIILELFGNIGIMITTFPPVVVIPAVLIILIIRKSRNKTRLKKRCFWGFVIFTGIGLLSEIVMYTDAINFIDSLAEILGGVFFVLFYYAVQTFCFIIGFILLIACMVLAVREKKHPVQETELEVKYT